MTASYVELIAKKRDGNTFSVTDIDRIVQGVANGDIPDYQIGALLMAIYLRGLSPDETAELTLAMVRSGETVDLSSIEGFKADKHSTGGVGDKVTLILGPLVAACGVKFPKLSGRGLAHTGGTLDKLESIPGMRVDLTLDEFVVQVRAIGLAVTGQTRELVPADGAIYALRDQTGTVDSVPLIASSVMSKKIAAGADGIVLDVKCGRGAFMKTLDDARLLARQMVDIGRAAGKQTRALITTMDQPLGCAIGNSVEVAEAIETIHGRGPADLREEVIALGAEILLMSGQFNDMTDAETSLRQKLEDGSAAVKLREMIQWQGGDPLVVNEPGMLPRPERIVPVSSHTSGFVQHIDALAIGSIAMNLGAGRKAKNEPVASAAGVVLRMKPTTDGERVDPGSILADLHVPLGWDPRVPLEELKERLRSAYTIGPVAPVESPTVLDRIS